MSVVFCVLLLLFYRFVLSACTRTGPTSTGTPGPAGPGVWLGLQYRGLEGVGEDGTGVSASSRKELSFFFTFRIE